MLLDMKEMSDPWLSYWRLRTATKYIFCPTKPSFSNFPALSLSPYLRKLIHLTFHKNTTPFSPNNPANPPGIKVSAREGWQFRPCFLCATELYRPQNLHKTPEILSLAALRCVRLPAFSGYNSISSMKSLMNCFFSKSVIL